MENKGRLIGIDCLRIVAAIMTLFFHGAIHGVVDSFGFFDAFVRMGAIFMTLFFIMSGYVLQYHSPDDLGGVIV